MPKNGGNPVSQLVVMTYTFPDGRTGNFNLSVENDLILQKFEIEYVPLSDGGPLMRPKMPPA